MQKMTEIKSITLEVIPMPTGPYHVGCAKYDLEDPYRKEFIFPNGRLIPIQVYFPMGNNAHITYPKIFEPRAPTLSPFFKTKVYSQEAKLCSLAGDKHPVVFLNHASNVAMTDYAFLAEDLSSHGYIVISLQHDLHSDAIEPKFWEGSSCSRNAKVIDNLLFVFQWLKNFNAPLFAGKVDLKRVGFVGHSLGANSLLLWISRNSDIFKKDAPTALLHREDQKDVKECLVLMEATRFSYPQNNRYPLFFLLAEEKESYQKECGFYDQMMSAGHLVRYYKGSTHISFMDSAYIKSDTKYFNGNLENRIDFFYQLRKEIREFLDEHLA
jgi:hypothetical protein